MRGMRGVSFEGEQPGSRRRGPSSCEEQREPMHPPTSWERMASLACLWFQRKREISQRIARSRATRHRPEMPHVPTPTRPSTPSGEAKMETRVLLPVAEVSPFFLAAFFP